MTTIDLRIALTVSVPDAAGVPHEYKLVEGLNDVPQEVADHWYVRKFSRPVRRVPRFVVPSAARITAIPRGVIAGMTDKIKDAPKPEAPVQVAPPAPQIALEPVSKEPPAAKPDKAGA